MPVFKHPILVQVLPTRPSTGNYKDLITLYSLRGHPAGDICSLTLFRSGSLPTRWFREGVGGGPKERLGRGMPPFDHLRSLNPAYPGSTPGMPPRPSDNVPVLDKI